MLTMLQSERNMIESDLNFEPGVLDVATYLITTCIMTWNGVSCI